tara:strand:+ start:836 stop:1399 length:564 start_codon:yes stop_codon:yes gene_type:complete
MNQKTYKRAHLRAPLKSKIICALDDQVLLGQTMNISEGGILFSKGPKLSQGDEFHLMVDLPDYPNFSNFDKEEILDLEWYSFEREVMRAKAKVMRAYETDFNDERVECYGCSFLEADKNSILFIKNYVESYSKNIVYLLGLFESLGRGRLKLPILRKVGFLMGYNSDDKIHILRSRVLHDYRSLEKL